MGPIYDEELLKNGDNRNVVDDYKNWTVGSIKEDLNTKRHNFSVAIENYQHDFNIGSIVRNANAFNAKSVHIIGKKHWNRRGAMATEKYLNVFQHANVDEFILWAKKNNQIIIGIDNIYGSENLSNVNLPKDCILVFGQEGPGLSKEIQKHCKQIVAIEQFGSTRSVNVGVASGIIMYEWVRRNILNS